MLMGLFFDLVFIKREKSFDCIFYTSTKAVADVHIMYQCYVTRFIECSLTCPLLNWTFEMHKDEPQQQQQAYCTFVYRGIIVFAEVLLLRQCVLAIVVF